MLDRDQTKQLDEGAEQVVQDFPVSAPYSAAVQSAATPQRHLADYLRVVYRRRWLAVTVFVLIVLSVGLYNFTSTPIYQARTRLLIESDSPNVVSFQEVIQEGRTRADYYQTQYSLLQSRALARKTLDELSLWSTPPFGGQVKSTFSLSSLAAGAIAWVGRFVGGEPEQVVLPAAGETAAQSRAVDALLSRLTVTPLRNSRLVDVTYRASDPDLAVRVANALTKAYIAQNLEYRFTATQEAGDWLGTQLSEQRKQVESAEVALQRYREQNDAISLEDRENIVVQKLADLNAAVTKAKTDRLQKEAVYRQLVAVEDNPAALDTFPIILGNQFIQQQKADLADLQRQLAQASEKLGDRHPEMIKLRSTVESAQRRIDSETRKVVQAVRTDYQAALAQERSMATALEQQKNEALTMNRRAIEYSVLARDVESSKQIYDSLLKRTNETSISGELKTSNIRVVDPAERPRSPSSPQTGTNLLLAVLGGAVVAIGLAFFFEYIDSRIRTPEEIKTHLGISALGLLPLLAKHDGHYPLLSTGVPQNFAEAFRSIRTNVLFSSAQEGSRSIVVTSSAPGEGKTMVASNLAIAIAQSNQRVLLIDADMRRPRVHESFSCPQEPGLSNVLVGKAKASEAIQKSDVPGLWLLPAGHLPPNPAELLGSSRCREFLVSLGGHFDWVVLDSPPVMAVTDAAVLAHFASGVLFVVGAEMTSRHVAARAVDQLDSAKARFVGGVLNRVDVDSNPYYYSHYYRREYAQYYTAQPKVG